MDWEGNANRIGLRKTEVLTSACASRFHSQVSRSPLKVCLHGDSDSILKAFLRSACEMDSFIDFYGNSKQPLHFYYRESAL